MAGNPDADPYTRAHFARLGRLPVTSTSALYYTAERDDEGYLLTSECDYALDGRPFDAAWWCITAYRQSALIETGTLQGTEGKGLQAATTQALDSLAGESAQFDLWLAEIAKESFDTLTFGELRAQADELTPIFETITTEDRYNELYNQ